MLRIPARMKELLEQNQAFHGFVLSSISNLETWISDNKTVFFPEYTDHALTHLNEVLLTADSIITDESWPHLTPQDSAAMIISVLLHDCAMHISEDGFYSLIEEKYLPINSRYVQAEKRWSLLWTDYIAEAKRFSAKKLLEIFGDENPVRDIPPNKLDLSGRDKLLIGEFIRRHHARLAHEISFNGVPGCGGETIKLGQEPEASFLDLCGFIARSHNMSLRSAVDRIESSKRQIHLNTHAPFIMLVLRISDYIQIHAERAPRRLLSIKGLVSPISTGEWKKHGAVIEINQAHTDPEAIYIDAEPGDALTFESLVLLFSSIQRELDMSWSVLGEVYGRYEPLCELGITIRRIRSSLDDVDVFLRQKKPNYIPRVLRFRTADSEMIELLIAPLYGDSPQVGIRELMQNAIDACVELKDLAVKQQVKLDPDVSDDVCVTIYDNGDAGGELVISDRGIGMTLDVVENFFLNIGASFRNSDRWKKDHETQGRSNVYRTGRFGIGLLAAYLLGDELKVQTRHISAPCNSGLQFSCKKGSNSIVVENVEKDYGTTISISLSKKIVESLTRSPEIWDWFCLESPKVVRRIFSKKETNLTQSKTVPGIDSALEGSNWRRTVAPGFDSVIWTYSQISDAPKQYFRDVSLICNGITITDRMYINSLDVSGELNIISADTPSIVVFDQDGRLPINLERTGLVSRELPFADELTEDLSSFIASSVIEYIQAIKPRNLQESLSSIVDMHEQGFGKSYSFNEGISKLILCGNSLIPVDLHLLARARIESIFIDASNLGRRQGAWTSDEFRRICSNYWPIDRLDSTKSGRSSWVRKFFEMGQERGGLSCLPICGRRIVINKTDVETIVAPGYVPKTFWNRLTVEWENKKWGVYSIGKVPSFDVDLDLMCAQLEKTASLGFSVIYLDWDSYEYPSSDIEESPFSRAWLRSNNGEIFSHLRTGTFFK